jgi:xanthine dehydrogenase YagT iron-sulfur-binding subunit
MGKKKDADKTLPKKGISRRGFMASVGAGAVAAAAVKGAAAEKVANAEETVQVVLDINGRKQRITVEPRYTLLYVLRDMLGLVATKEGCNRGECGACTVLLDGEPRYACMTLAVEAEGHEIETLEGLMKGEELGVVQQAFAEEDAYQCGFCTPGQVVAMEGMLRQNNSPKPEEIRSGMSGNICRCGAYKHIFNAAENASAKLKNGGGK